MKNSIVIVILLIAGISHNAYAMDLTDQQKSNEQRKSLSRQPTAEERYPESRLYIQQEKAESYKQGIEEGKLEGKLETARRLLSKGMAKELIMDIAQLNEEQFATLQQHKKPMEE